MTVHQQLSSPRLSRPAIGTAARIAALALLVLWGLEPLVAADQKVITTLIPKVVTAEGDVSGEAFQTGKPVLLRFTTRALPGTSFDSARLRLVCKSMMDRVAVDIQVFLVDETWDKDKLAANRGKTRKELEQLGARNLGYRSFNEERPGAEGVAEWLQTEVPADLRGQGGNRETTFVLLLWPSRAAGRGWYSANAASREKRPRLTLERTVSGQPAATHSGGLPGARSPRAFLPSAGSERWLGVFPAGLIAELAQSADVPRLNAVASNAPVFFNDQIYVTTKSPAQLRALPALGGKPPWTPMSIAAAGQHLALSGTERLYIVGAGSVLAYRLYPSEPKRQPSRISLTSPSGIDPALPPAVGLDGSLYFVNGQEVYGLNPDLQLLWKLVLEKKLTSRPTVGPSGRFVYLVGQAEGLITIDARTGDVIKTPLSNGDELSAEVKPALHAPVVLRHPDGTEKIYVAANAGDEGSLSSFDNQRTRTDRPGQGGVVATESWQTQTEGLFSQPMAGEVSGSERNIYVVRVKDGQGQLLEVEWLKGSSKPVGDAFPVGRSSYLVNGGNLALARDGSVLVWNGSQAKLLAFAPASGGSYDAALASGPQVESSLLFGTDGTLYAADDDRELRVLLPSYEISASQTTGLEISSPTHLRVGGTAAAGTWTFGAHGEIFLGKGFTVRQNVVVNTRVGDEGPL